jgi:hypothetical protein
MDVIEARKGDDRTSRRLKWRVLPCMRLHQKWEAGNKIQEFDGHTLAFEEGKTLIVETLTFELEG